MQSFNSRRWNRLGALTLPPSVGYKPQQGFTLLELMVTVTVLGVLMTMAAPNFENLIQRWRIRQAAELFQSTLYLARSEAKKRGGGVIVEKLPCKNDWNCGWQVCHSSRDTCDGDAVAIQRHELPEHLDIVPKSDIKKFVFNRYGRIKGPRGMGISISPKDQGIKHEATRGVCIASGGRIRIVLKDDVPCND